MSRAVIIITRNMSFFREMDKNPRKINKEQKKNKKPIPESDMNMK